MADSCGAYVSADDLKAAKESILHIEHVATSKDANGNPALVVTDDIRGEDYTNTTLDGLRSLYNEAISKIGFVTKDSFEDGATLNNPVEVLRWKSNGVYYRWDGDFPKTVPAGSTPLTSGGEGQGAWLAVIDPRRQTITLQEFGAKGDGVTNDAPAISAAFDYALANNVSVIQNSGTFFLDGSTYINIKNLDTDLTGSVIKPSATYTGQIVISQPDVMTTFGAGSSPVNAINSSTSVSRAAGSNLFDGMVSNTDLNGSFVQISTSQPMYIFRDTAYTRMDLNRVYNRGNMENSLRYGIGTNVTSIKSLKIRGAVQTVRGLTIDESLTTRYRIIYINQASRVLMKNTSFINRPVTQSFSDTRMDIEDCYDVTVDGLFAPSVSDSVISGSDVYSYTIGLSKSMNVHIKHCSANGEGWGATGSNNCANVTFEGCDLSRIDFHMPFQNYLKIDNCNIGRHGVLVTGIGDLDITNSTFNASPDTISNIIATRADAGGFFDGNLYMDNITLTGRRTAGTVGVAFINGTSTAGQGPSVGSPIKSTLFNKIYLRDIKLREGSIENTFSTFISSNADNVLLFPSLIDVDGFDFAALPKSSGIGFDINFSRFKALYSDMTNSESSVSGRVTTDIILNNLKSPLVSITSASARHNPRVLINNCRHTLPGDGSMTFTTNQRGNYDLNECVLDNVRLISGTSPNGSVYLKVNGGKIIQPTAANLLLTVSEDTHFIELNDVCIVGQFSGQDALFPVTRNLMKYSLMNDCDYWDYASSTKLSMLQYSTPTPSTSLTSTIPFKLGQKIVVATGYTSTSTYTKSVVESPDMSQVRTVNTLGAGNLICTFTASGLLFSQVVMTSPTGNEVVGLFVK